MLAFGQIGKEFDLVSGVVSGVFRFKRIEKIDDADAFAAFGTVAIHRI